ncbi:hypothetical protein FA10DRAFT_268885 [Acaromyces ingoldii]|uniref:Uncharacterized protein n=1 Tax=Acaromyces ingoldii TaxID=215250 RepID=A0A316YGR8_9BASI|nr:hypothetical protein FA10DRAFT_268885 [Acaromyces ingoldii]PWN88730.1 hypothetical protein FA10DRAFT_268885 [Acaromyces ingoldii]
MQSPKREGQAEEATAGKFRKIRLRSPTRRHKKTLLSPREVFFPFPHRKPYLCLLPKSAFSFSRTTSQS